MQAATALLKNNPFLTIVECMAVIGRLRDELALLAGRLSELRYATFSKPIDRIHELIAFRPAFDHLTEDLAAAIEMTQRLKQKKLCQLSNADDVKEFLHHKMETDEGLGSDERAYSSDWAESRASLWDWRVGKWLRKDETGSEVPRKAGPLGKEEIVSRNGLHPLS